MIGWFAAKWAATALFRGRLFSFLKGVPWWVWALFVAVLVGWRGIAWHERTVKAAISAAETRGETRAYAAMKKQALALKQKMEGLAARTKELQSAINTSERIAYEKAAAGIVARADARSLRGAGAASADRHCPGIAAAVPGPSGGHEQAGRIADGGVDRVPVSGGLAIVPWAGLNASARQCDLWREEVLSWRRWHPQQQAAYEAWARDVTATSGKP